jgi:hypothetical protein
MACWAAVGMANTTGLDTKEEGLPSTMLGFAAVSCELHTDD